MPPPDVLDGLTNALLETIRCAAKERASAGAKSPTLSIGNLDIDCSSIEAWPHSWDETRHKLAALALADTRLGAELANRKLTRQERLARPGIKRVGSMDYLDDEESQAKPSERIGRVLRLSTTLQNSARGIESSSLARAPSLGAAPASASLARAPSLNAAQSSSRSPPTRPADAPSIPSPMVRSASSLSISSAGSMSRRPSLLARGRSFTASDLEAERAEDEAANAPGGDVSITDEFGVGKLVELPDEISPRTPTDVVFEPAPVPVLPAAENTPAVAVSGPSPPEADKDCSPPHKRRVQPPPLGRSKSYGPSSREAHMRRDSFLAPPMPQAPKVLATEARGGTSPAPSVGGDGEGLQGAFEWSAPGSSRVPAGWESEDSDREGMSMKKPRRKMRGTLAMTALNAAAGRSDSGSSCSSRSRSASLSASSEGESGACTPPLIISTMVDEAALGGGCLRSPFEEREVELA